MSQTKAQLLDGKSATIQFTGGSASAPSVSFTGDTNTGIYSPGADQVAISTNGSGRLFVDASGRVGVGTTSPGYLLDVAGSARIKTGATGTPFIVSTGSDSQGTLRFGSASNEYSISSGADYLAMIFNVNAGEAARIDSSGRLGIGTSSPGRNLHVAGSSATALIESTGSTNADLLIGDGGVRYYGIRGVAGGGSLQIRNDTANTTLATFTSTGLVGIGTTSPAAKLHINNGTNENVHFTTGGSGDQRVQALNDAGSTTVQLSIQASPLLFRGAGGTEVSRIDSSGRLLVGTSSASGVNSNTAPVLAGNFVSFTGSVSANHNTATTLFTLENLNATYMVTAVITGTANAGAYHAVYIIGSVVTNSHSIQALKAGSLLTLSLSGANVQATQGSGVAQTVTWSVTRMANL